MILGAVQDYLPLHDIWQIVAVCLGVSVVAPAAAALAINGFDAQSKARAAGTSRVGGDVRVAIGVIILVGLAVVGILALING